MLSMRVGFYTTGTGRQPVMDFVNGLPARLRGAIFEAFDAIEAHGQQAPGLSTRQIQGKLWEIRVRAGGAARIFYFVRGAEVVLLHAYPKKRKRRRSGRSRSRGVVWKNCSAE